MATKSLLTQKDQLDLSRNYKRGPDKQATATRELSDGDSSGGIRVHDSETANERTWGGETLEEELRRLCHNRFRKCCEYDMIDSSTESDSSYVPRALKKLIKKTDRTEITSSYRKKSGLRSESRCTKSNRSGISKNSYTTDPKRKPKSDMAKTVSRAKKSVPPKEEVAIQKSAASKSSDKHRDSSGRNSRSKLLAVSSKSSFPPSTSKPRKSIIEILFDPTIDQKEAERMVTEMHKQARDNRVDELEGYLDEVKRAIRVLDVEEGVADEDDYDWVDLSPDLNDSGEENEESWKMDAQAMRAMLTALAGREAKEDAVASVANIGASWRTVPHDQLNCCLSMDPKLLGDHRQRVKRNYEEFDKVFQPPKEGEEKKMQHITEDDAEERLPEEGKLETPKPGNTDEELKETESVNIAELTREQMLEIHDKIGPWVLHHTKKLDKFIQTRKYTPQYLLNHWNGELSDDDSEVDFEKYRSAWKKNLEDREYPGEGESQPPIQPEDRVPSLQENNWFLFPTPMTRSYSTETDEQGWDGQRTRPFSHVAMEGLVKHLKRQQEVEKSRKFHRENPWPPPSRYPPEVNTEPEVKYIAQEVHENEEESKIPN